MDRNGGFYRCRCSSLWFGFSSLESIELGILKNVGILDKLSRGEDIGRISGDWRGVSES